MAGNESLIQVTEGVGKKAHTWQRTISGNTVEDEFTIPGEYPYATYVALGASVSIATANDHIIQVMAGTTLPVRIRRIRVEQRAAATAAAASVLEIWRLTTAGTGGAAVTPRPLDTADTAGATAMTLPTAKGTESVQLYAMAHSWRQVVSATGSPADDSMEEWIQMPNGKPLIIPAGTTNGIAVKSTTAIAGATVIVTVEFVETNFV